ncbi:hypothetical protein BB559_004128 [Furculomyces boomerangus]|uniref:Uncharacterized protein n=2 Tax=Harpellales TaxID=61421 RepID=A0A2T9XYT0_9FUNG|nr:hypothetical protein BB559_007123 [Furculomyces boomerangus]PVU91457.1 hypothetical protein BB559_004128 [Furculomyces boomerangus]PVZ96808.1 hypothetical protein BB558_007266 [Smittium angustum]PWA01507.1 hypothetical protein BB558_002397 [Smittium angustum]
MPFTTLQVCKPSKNNSTPTITAHKCANCKKEFIIPNESSPDEYQHVYHYHDTCPFRKWYSYGTSDKPSCSNCIIRPKPVEYKQRYLVEDSNGNTMVLVPFSSQKKKESSDSIYDYEFFGEPARFRTKIRILREF